MVSCLFNGGGDQPSNRDLLREEAGKDEIQLYRSTNHMKNFLECMRSRKDPIAPIEVAHRSDSACILTHIAMKLGRRLKWDPEAERFPNDEEANRWLGLSPPQTLDAVNMKYPLKSLFGRTICLILAFFRRCECCVDPP